MNKQVISVVIALLSFFQAEYSYAQRNNDFNRRFEQGDLKDALSFLEANQSQAGKKNKFLYFVNRGLVLSIMGQYGESNDYFEKAYLFGEDYHINYVYEAASYLSNPMVTIYRGEDHEHLMLLYYKAINFLKMNKPDEALVECRRLDIRLQKLSDKYTSEKKYQRDAFVHTLMGIIYQSRGDFNNAFIAYRNAVDIYENDYQSMFAMITPEQLKKDLLNCAWWTGFRDEFEVYRDKFGMSGYEPVQPEADLVFFWHNGLAPVKSEWSINFVIHHDGPDMVIFRNENLGLSFPFEMKDDRDKKEKHDLADLEFFRVAFPKYLERSSYYNRATLQLDSAVVLLEEAENISKIAFYSLEQRMYAEFAKGLLRAALKKAGEQSMRKESEGLGALIGIVNAITERADTRNWQTLPHSIYYSRVALREGENKVRFIVEAEQDKAAYDFTYKASKGQTLFHTFSSLETSAAPHRISGLTD